MSRVCLLACTLVVFCVVTQSQYTRRRSLTEITYRFTNCNSTSTRHGPSVNSMCRPFYESVNSPLVSDPGTLFQFEPETSYSGAQGFRVPRDDVYNITIAGAHGGEGVCNFHYGRGGVLSAQVRLTTDYEYLILVGHRGSSVCDLPDNVNHPVCQLQRPTTFREAQICDIAWYNWTEMFENGIDKYRFNGGGGGGGASMVWPRRADNQEFTDYPLMIAPGGGGSSGALLYEHFLNLTVFYFINGPNTTDLVERYQYHLDGHHTRYLVNDIIWPEGVQGYTPDDSAVISGTGGGWQLHIDIPLQSVGGELLSQENNFAVGGVDCTSTLAPGGSQVFANVFGGYGGGGGGCGSGGGGGGYTGGHVLDNYYYVPGGGGDTVVFVHSEFPLSDDVPFTLNDANGFVEIVPSNCGCAGQCVVYTNESQFECLCPNDTMLANDLRNCFQEVDVPITEEDPLEFSEGGETYCINWLQFDESFFIFGLDVLLSVSPKPGSTFPNQDVACAVVFVGSDFQSILASNPVRPAEDGSADELTILGNTTEGFGPTTNYVSFLEDPILVTGALLLTNGDCYLSSAEFLVNISSERSNTPPSQIVSGLNLLVNSTTSARLILGLGNTTSPATVPVEAGQTVGPVIAACILIAVVAGVLLLLFCKYRRWRNMVRYKRSIDLSTLPEALSVERQRIVRSRASYTLTITNSNSQALLSASDEQHYKMVFSSILVPYASLNVKEEIGQGAFGVVFRGELRRPGVTKAEDIAIKTIKNGGSQAEIKPFFEESLLMKDFKHPNILGLAGVCFDTPDGVPYILLPFMANGSLKDYLKKNRVHATSVDQLPKDTDDATLVRMCMDIAAGMEYLAGQKFVHRDLAARNCMVDELLMIKVGDFGLARDVYSNDYYRAGKEAMVPVKWMAPETLQDGISNEKTDVWSFGVTCWEVFSLGRVPYPGISNKDVLKHITVEKERLQKPALCPEQLYTLAMSSCWKLLPEDRPTFSQLVSELQEYWEEQHAYMN